MSKLEPIRLTIWPIWDKQPDEPDDVYLRFKRFFLPLSKPILANAYRAYLESLEGKKGQFKKDVPTSWRNDCATYQWRSRHQDYWLKQSQDNLEWLQQKQRQLIERELVVCNKLFDKAETILNMGINPDNDRIKDSAALVRCASEISRKSLNMTNLDSAIKALESAGFVVINATDNQGENNA
jgi:hypothetical protein